MKKYAIMRHSKTKFKTFSQLDSADKHNKREIEVPNSKKEASPGRDFRRVLGGGKKTSDILKEKLAKYDIKPRKNASLAMEYVMTFSPEMKGKVDLQEWIKANMEWIKKEHGEGVLSIDVHLDESTPHIHAIVAPLIEKEVRGRLQMRLSGIDFWKGKDKLIARQDRYAEAMQKFGLERGVRGSKAHHKTIKTFYRDLLQSLEKTLHFNEKLPNAEKAKPTLSNFRKMQKVLKTLTNKLSDVTGMFASQLDRNKLLERENERLKREIEFRDQKLHHSGVNKLETALEESILRANDLSQKMFDQKKNHNIKIADMQKKIDLLYDVKNRKNHDINQELIRV